MNAPWNTLAPRPNSAFIDAYQHVRKETKMEVVHLITNSPGADSDSRRLARRAGPRDGARNQRQLATRWGISEATLDRWQ